VLEGIPYIGLGLGAQSFSRHSLSYNLGAVTKRMFQYVKSTELGRIPIQDLYHLSKPQAIGKFCAVSFYFGGVHRGHFKDCFGLNFDDYFSKEIAFLKHHQLMEDAGENGERLGMTAAGKKHFSGVVSLFYAPSVQNYLVRLPGGDPWSLEERRALGDGKIGAAPWAQWPPANGQAVEAPRAPAAPVVKKSARRGGVADGGRDELQDQDWEIQRRATTQSDWARANADGSVTMQINGTIVQRPASGATLSAGSASSNTPIRTFSTVIPITSSATPLPPSMISNFKSLATGTKGDRPAPHYEFGNILFAGPCNQKCPFCIGAQIDPNLSPNNLKKWPLENLDAFITQMKETKTKKLIMTGTVTDPQLYKHEEQLIQHMREQLPGIHISLHTNGLLALPKMKVFNMYDNCTLSINSFNPETFAKLHGVKTMPNLPEIIKQSKIPIKLSCVVTEDNRYEIDDYLKRAAELGIKRVAIRHLFNNKQSWRLFENLTPQKMFCNNPVYNIHGMEVTYWHFDHTSGESLNLFADGTLSGHYLLAKAPKRENVQAAV
jgi:pyruvate-formate lyase-activating enzyme